MNKHVIQVALNDFFKEHKRLPNSFTEFEPYVAVLAMQNRASTKRQFNYLMEVMREERDSVEHGIRAGIVIASVFWIAILLISHIF